MRDNLNISIDLRSRTPIYEQIINGVKEAALAGILAPDEQIPPIRRLTRQLGINPNTIQKAYAELERQGVIYTLAGRGAFISGETDSLADAKREEILIKTKDLANEAKKYFIPKEFIEEIINEAYDSQNNNNRELI